MRAARRRHIGVAFSARGAAWRRVHGVFIGPHEPIVGERPCDSYGKRQTIDQGRRAQVVGWGAADERVALN